MSRNDVIIKEITKDETIDSVQTSKKPFCNKLNYIGEKKDSNYNNQIKFKENMGSSPGVTIITSTIREHCLENVFNNYSGQNHNPKELIIILNNNSMNIESWRKKAKQFENVRIYKIDEKKSLGSCLNFAIDKAKYNFISKFDDDNFYGPAFIGGLMNAFKANKADIVGKNSYFLYFTRSKTLALKFPKKENKYVGFLSGSALIIKKRVFDKVRFPEKNLGEDTDFLRNCLKNKFKLYSADRYNYVCMRRPNLNDHTWKAKEQDLLKDCKIIKRTDDFYKYVVKEY